MPKTDDLTKEYNEISQALTRWFISQDVNVGRACGAMCYLAGIIIAECAYKGLGGAANLSTGIRLHQNLIEGSAIIAMSKLEGDGQ